jgi:glycosyltransferase involved in cell wall biosynthesis
VLSILMSCYNSAPFLREAMESVLAQTFGDFEFLVIDDGSTDGTNDIIRQYARHDGRIRLIAHENRGIAAALNGGIAQAKHEWIFRFDPDDVMLPDRLAKQRAFLRRNPDLVVASGLAILINAKGEEIGRSRSPYVTHEAVAKVVAGPNLIGFHHPAVAMRKSVVLGAGGFRPHTYPADDLDLWNRLAEAGHRMLVQEDYLIKYRQHASSVSIASNRRQVVTMEWLADCKAHRKNGVPERSLEKYLIEINALPWTRRWNHRRRIAARTLYKSAIVRLAGGNRPGFLMTLAAAGLLDPALVGPRVWARIRPGASLGIDGLPSTPARPRPSLFEAGAW